jgi:hypothetical protein
MAGCCNGPGRRIFVHRDHELPLLIPVHDKKVSDEYLEKIRQIIGEG